jgi:alpha-L-arabinofuranosidase
MLVDHQLSVTAKVAIQAEQPKPISPDLFGIFFEDLNYAADGGLYAELIQNRSFAYSAADHPDWNFLTAWGLLQHSGSWSVALQTAEPIHSNNPHYIVLRNAVAEGMLGLRNTGFDGIALQSGEEYNVALFARVLDGSFAPLRVRLEGRTGALLGVVDLPAPTATWAKYTATIQCDATDPYGRCVVEVAGAGSLALDVISLFPRKTFQGRSNGLRADLAQAIADLKPRFVRFPGGCLVHGDGLENMYRWKDSIGPIETRKEQPNIWNYHQSLGLGYYEYFQFCEDIGAKPVPVVPAGCCCPNTGARWTGLWEQGQCGLPMDGMAGYAQEVLDLIEWANGPATSPWGAKRAAAGHPEPFGLQYLGVGNEDAITPVFRQRFQLIYDAVKARYPEITVIGTVGPRPQGEDYEAGWQFARELNLEMVDEHEYKSPEWHWEQLARYDAYERNATTVYLGEYAAHESSRLNTLRSALAEAAFMTALERNGDVVRMTSYAPLLAKQRHLHWVPDLIYFDNTRITPSINYYVQQLFSHNAGDQYLPVTIDIGGEQPALAVSCVCETATGDLIVKLVSRSDAPIHAQIDLALATSLFGEAQCSVLAGDPFAVNSFGQPPSVQPQVSRIQVEPHFTYEIPPHSLSIIRMKTRITTLGLTQLED